MLCSLLMLLCFLLLLRFLLVFVKSDTAGDTVTQRTATLYRLMHALIEVFRVGEVRCACQTVILVAASTSSHGVFAVRCGVEVLKVVPFTGSEPSSQSSCVAQASSATGDV